MRNLALLERRGLLPSEPGNFRARETDTLSVAKAAGATNLQLFYKFYILLSDNEIGFVFCGVA
jgi:hypothetical protein